MRKKLWICMVALFIAASFTWRFYKSSHNIDISNVAVTAMTNGEANIETSIFNGSSRRFVAHRGYSGEAPENSIDAFEMAGRAGFWGVETDISETRDGRFVCMHDDTIDRTTDGEGAVGDYTYNELTEFTIDSGNNLRITDNRQIPTLEEYLEICKRYNCVPIVEIKTIFHYDSFVKTIEQYGFTHTAVVTGPIDAISKVREINPDIYVMVIGYSPEPYNQNLKEISAIERNRGVLYNYPQIDEDIVSLMHDKDMICGVWTINKADTAEEYFDYGVDFIVTNEIPGTLAGMTNGNR